MVLPRFRSTGKTPDHGNSVKDSHGKGWPGREAADSDCTGTDGTTTNTVQVKLVVQ